jgi:transglutaminase-like putative cysteine protease
LKEVRQPEYGNEVLYAETSKADKAEYKFSVDYDVMRREHVVLVNGKPLSDARSAKAPRVELARFLEADRLVPVTGLPAQLAAQETKGATMPLEKAKDIYEYVFRTMKYDKTGTGWGRGDVLYACDAKKGNCTDFHSLFIAMARSQGIPARFEIGFPLPPDKHSAEIAGYHCWSDFYIDGKGWIPVDISEAWKHQEKHDYFFGSHDVNRVQFSMGRDLRLTPPQDGKPLNYFVYPYVEVDGQEDANVSLAFSFADVAPTVAQK